MADKKKLSGFLSDLLKIGCTKGFKYFATHLRGREEVICSIINEPTIPILLSATNSPAASFPRQDALPKDPDSMMISQKQQRRLSGYGFINVGLPPASPSESEEDVDENSTMFLIAGYARYNGPYVWVRSNHDRLVRLSSEDCAEKDYPLQLQTTSQWQEKDIKVWDIVTELVQICTSPCPPNPFAVDFDYFEALHLPERALAAGAMAHFLQRLLASGAHPYDRRVQSDLLKIAQVHFHAMLRLVQTGSVQPSLIPSEPEQPQQRRRSRPGSSPVKRLSAGQMPQSPLQPQPLAHYPATSYSTSAGGQPPPPSQHYYNPPPAGSSTDTAAGGGGQFYSGRRSGYTGMY